MKTIERLRELVARVKAGPKELTAKGMEEWSNADLVVYNALPALLAVVEAQDSEIAAWRAAEEECRAIENACDMHAARSYIARARDKTDAALRSLEGDAEVCKERDAQAEAVRVLGAEVHDYDCVCRSRNIQAGGENISTIGDDVMNNPIARAAVEGER